VGKAEAENNHALANLLKKVASTYRYWGTAWSTIGLSELLPEPMAEPGKRHESRRQPVVLPDEIAIADRAGSNDFPGCRFLGRPGG
jgi:hypothetical protein